MPPKKNSKNTEEARTRSQDENKENTNLPSRGKDTAPHSKRDAKDCTEHWEDAVQLKHDEKEYEEFKKSDASEEQQDLHDSGNSEESGSGPKKRGRGANQKGQAPKKQKKGATKDGPRGTAGDKTRVPKKGQEVQWHALPGYVDGEVVEVLYEDKTVDGKNVKANKAEPRIVLKSASSGKIAVHKPEAVFFD